MTALIVILCVLAGGTCGSTYVFKRELKYRDNMLMWEHQRDPIVTEFINQAMVMASVPQHSSTNQFIEMNASREQLVQIIDIMNAQEVARLEASIPFKRARAFLRDWEIKNRAPAPPLYFGYPKDRRPLNGNGQTIRSLPREAFGLDANPPAETTAPAPGQED